MRELEIFKKLDKKKYHIWTVAGGHFRCAEFIYYLFVELAIDKIQVSYNLFAECHGKSSRDQHFSVIGFFIKEAMFNKKLTSTNDVIAAIESGQVKSNINRSDKKLKPIQTIALEHRPEITILNEKQCVRKIMSLKTYYNFFNDDQFMMYSTIFSDLTKKIQIEYKDMTIIRKAEDITGKNKAEVIVEDINADLEALIVKRDRISNILDEIVSVVFFLSYYKS